MADRWGELLMTGLEKMSPFSKSVSLSVSVSVPPSPPVSFRLSVSAAVDRWAGLFRWFPSSLVLLLGFRTVDRSRRQR